MLYLFFACLWSDKLGWRKGKANELVLVQSERVLPCIHLNPARQKHFVTWQNLISMVY